MADNMQGFERIGPVASPDMGGFEKTSPGGDQGSALGALFRGFLHGSMDIIRGGAQIGVRMAQAPQIGQTAPEMPGRVGAIDQAVQQSEQAYQTDPRLQGGMRGPAAGLGRFLGNAATTLPLAMGPGASASIPARIGAGVAAGAAGALMQPVTGGTDYWSEKAQQVGLGMAAGGAIAGAGQMIGPALRSGQRDAISQFPHLAGLVRGTAIRSPDNFNRAAVNQALDPIGAAAPANMKAGHGLIAWGKEQLSGAYDKVLPKLNVAETPELTQQLSALRGGAKEMPPDQEKQFENIFARRIEKRFKDGNGYMDGTTLKQIQSELGNKASSYASSSDAAQRELGDNLFALRQTIMDAAAAQNPEAAAQLRRVDQAYAMFSRVQAASVRSKVSSKGVFSPDDLAMAARAGDRSRGKSNFATGDAMMQQFAEAAAGPMATQKINRTLNEILGGLGALGGFHVAGLPGGVGGAIAGAAAPQLARGAMRATQTPFARGLGRGMAGAAPTTGAYSASTADRLKAASKVGEIQTKLYAAKRRGDIAEVQSLQRDLADADANYRYLRGGR